MSERLPRPDELIVDPEKLRDYLLCDDHPDGSAKARFFLGLGFEARHWRLLADALIEHGQTREIQKSVETPFGNKYVVQCVLTTPEKRNLCISSVWIAEPSQPPRLVTAYPA